MLTTKQKHTIETLINNFFVVSGGGNDSTAIAYASAIASEALGEQPAKIEMELSAKVAKSAMYAGVYGSKHVGAAFVAAAGGIFGKSENGFEILDSISEDGQEYAYHFSKENVKIELVKTSKPIFIQIVMYGGGKVKSKKNYQYCNKSRVVIEDHYQNVVLVERNGVILYSAENCKKAVKDKGIKSELEEITMKEIFDYVNTTDNLEVIKRTVALNKSLSNYGKENDCGINAGKVQPFAENTIFSRIISTTTAAVDARMSGAFMASMTGNGCKNQEIAAILPIVQLSKEIGTSDELMYKAAMVSVLSAMYVRNKLESVSHICDVAIASVGTAAGIVYIMNGSYKQAENAMQIMLGTLTGIFCDGAKGACAMKVCTCISTGMYAANIALSLKEHIEEDSGVVGSNLKQTIKNITKIAKDSDKVMEKSILDIIVR